MAMPKNNRNTCLIDRQATYRRRHRAKEKIAKHLATPFLYVYIKLSFCFMRISFPVGSLILTYVNAFFFCIMYRWWQKYSCLRFFKIRFCFVGLAERRHNIELKSILQYFVTYSTSYVLSTSNSQRYPFRPMFRRYTYIRSYLCMLDVSRAPRDRDSWNYNRDIENALRFTCIRLRPNAGIINTSGILIFALPNQLEHYK